MKITRFVLIFAALTATLNTNVTQATPVVWLDFTGWDHATVTGGGQLFADIFNTTDVLVSGTPGNSLMSYFNNDIHTGGSLNSHSFTFTFSDPLELFVDVTSIDMFEQLSVSSGNLITYTHALGAPPTQSGNLTITGNAVGMGPNGAVRGEMSLGTATSFTWSYTALANNKYERFRVGTIAVPEPSLGAWCLTGLLATIARRRGFLVQ